MVAADTLNMKTQLKIMEDELKKNVMKMNAAEGAKKGLEGKVARLEANQVGAGGNGGNVRETGGHGAAWEYGETDIGSTPRANGGKQGGTGNRGNGRARGEAGGKSANWVRHTQPADRPLTVR